nr:MAG TPA: hypothetical protein [Caudoviricetes sp.]
MSPYRTDYLFTELPASTASLCLEVLPFGIVVTLYFEE